MTDIQLRQGDASPTNILLYALPVAAPTLTPIFLYTASTADAVLSDPSQATSQAIALTVASTLPMAAASTFGLAQDTTIAATLPFASAVTIDEAMAATLAATLPGMTSAVAFGELANAAVAALLPFSAAASMGESLDLQAAPALPLSSGASLGLAMSASVAATLASSSAATFSMAEDAAVAALLPFAAAATTGLHADTAVDAILTFSAAVMLGLAGSVDVGVNAQIYIGASASIGVSEPTPPPPAPVVVQAYGASYSFVNNNLLEELLEEEKAKARTSGISADPIDALLARVDLPGGKAAAEESATLLREAIEAAPAEALGLEDVVVMKDALARVEAKIEALRKGNRRAVFSPSITRRPANLKEKVAAMAVMAAVARWLA